MVKERALVIINFCYVGWDHGLSFAN